MTHSSDYSPAVAGHPVAAPDYSPARTAEAPGRQPVSDWAELYGLTDEDALALAATCLAGLAGGLTSLVFCGTPQPLEPLALVTSTDSPALPALDKLTSSTLKIQRLLVQRSRSLSLPQIKAAYLDLPARQGDPALDSIHTEPRISGFQLSDDLGAMIQNDILCGDRDRAFEKYTRPAMILCGTLHEPLAASLARHHIGSAVAAPGVVRLPADKKKRTARIDELMRCAQGVETESIALHRQTPGDRELVRLCGLIAMPPADLRWLLEHRRDFFEVFLPWLPPRRPDGPGRSDLNRALAFETQAARVAQHLVAARRTLAVPPAEFQNPEVAGNFLRQMAKFRTSCFSLGDDRPIAHADRLMPALAFAASRCGNRPPEEWIADSAHTAARHLAGCAARFFERASHEELAASRLRLAGKIVARIAKLGPIKRRELVRGFARQSAGLFNPVLDTLVALGVIRRDGLLLDLGPVPAARMAREDFVPPPASLPFEPRDPYGSPRQPA